MTEPTTPDTRTVQLRLPAAVEELAGHDTSANGEPDALALAIRRMSSRTPEQVMADRERVLALSPAPRPLPAGKTLADVVGGTWPGDETDEAIYEMLERLS